MGLLSNLPGGECGALGTAAGEAWALPSEAADAVFGVDVSLIWPIAWAVGVVLSVRRYVEHGCGPYLRAPWAWARWK